MQPSAAQLAAQLAAFSKANKESLETGLEAKRLELATAEAAERAAKLALDQEAKRCATDAQMGVVATLTDLQRQFPEDQGLLTELRDALRVQAHLSARLLMG